MLSPGTYHERVPRDRIRNLKFRRFVLRRCQESKARRRAILHACRQDVLMFINVFVWQYNPNTIGRASAEVGPFLTWGFQERAILGSPASLDPDTGELLPPLPGILTCIEERCDLAIEKSREMGASWMCLLVVLWLYLFHPLKKFLVISRNEEAVDRPGDPDCLFWKLDFVLDHLPDWMKEGRVERRKMGFTNSLLRSFINGQASTGRAGVGGRATAMFIDEFSQIKEDREVFHRTTDTTGCRIFNGTHLGPETCFYELTDPGSLVGRYMKKLKLHWTQHPDKIAGLYRVVPGKGGVELLDRQYVFPPDYQFVLDGTPSGGPHPGVRSPWYDEQCRRKGNPRQIAMDLDIDAQGSVSQFFNALMIRQLQETYCVPPYWEGEVHGDRDTGKPDAQEPLQRSEGGPLKLWLNLEGRGHPPVGVYAAGADIAAGTGATPSVLSVVDCKTGEKVLEYVTPFLPPEAFAAKCVALCRLFKDESGSGALFAWEMQGPGGIFGQRVIEMGYRRIYYRVQEQKLAPKAKADTPGWYPSPLGRRLLLDEYEAALRKREFINRSRPALEECLDFRYVAGGDVKHAGEESTADPSGARANHGDRVIADALAWKMCRQLGYEGARPQAPAIMPGSFAWRRQLHEKKRQGA